MRGAGLSSWLGGYGEGSSWYSWGKAATELGSDSLQNWQLEGQGFCCKCPLRLSLAHSAAAQRHCCLLLEPCSFNTAASGSSVSVRAVLERAPQKSPALQSRHTVKHVCFHTEVSNCFVLGPVCVFGAQQTSPASNAFIALTSANFIVQHSHTAFPKRPPTAEDICLTQ